MASSSIPTVVSSDDGNPSQDIVPLTFWERSAEGGTLVPKAWYDGLKEVGQVFRDKKTFTETLVNYSIARGFNFLYISNKPARVTAKCAAVDKECPWRIHASLLRNCTVFQIKTWNKEHTCGGGIRQRGHPRASKGWVANLMKPALKASPGYAPKDMKKDILRDYGVDVNYHKVWHAKELAVAELHGKEAHGFSQLRWYCEQVNNTNPGSLACYEKDSLGRFSRLFICYGGPLEGYIRGCRKIMFLDGTHLSSRYQGVMLAANGKNGNQGTFPLAFCICGAENESNWRWFLVQLHEALYRRDCPLEEQLTFISDRDKGLVKSVEEVFPDAFHSFCLRHLEKNFADTAGEGMPLEIRRVMPEWLQKAAYAMTLNDWDDAIAYIGENCRKGVQFIEDSQPTHWANMYFEGQRYGEMYSNLAESFNSWAREARQLPLLQLLECMRNKVMEQIYRRGEKAKGWTTTFCPKIHQEIEWIIQQSR